ncbi:hypothetical protein MKW98_019746 [Papaver atlanticum]|uniref:Uncharacterized protein n=1 Tax=Papaver atlanticum TaxID=357466 RepID=A0AAD4XWP8_9MAGN|nr:hypothetical protein MKW98_019746 [Papaver atlanticum]
MWSLPASPRWLLLRAVQGKASLQEYKERAITGLSKLRGRPAGDEVSEKQVEETLVSLKEAYANQESEGSFWEVVQGLSLKALTICGGVVLFLQVTEHPGVLHYAGSILKTSGFAAISVAAGVLAVIGLFKVIMTGVAVLKVDNLFMVSLLFLSAYNKIHGGYPAVAVGALLLYVSCYQISFVPISWLMISEIFHIRTRERGISLAALNFFGANVLFIFVPSSFKNQLMMGMLNYLLFVIISLVFLLSVVFIVPETKG